MSTDTAVLVSNLILDGGMDFSEIPFVDNPEIENKEEEGSSVIMEGFRYVSTSLDLKTCQKTDKPSQPLMNEYIRDNLLFVDFDLGLM